MGKFSLAQARKTIPLDHSFVDAEQQAGAARHQIDAPDGAVDFCDAHCVLLPKFLKILLKLFGRIGIRTLSVLCGRRDFGLVGIGFLRFLGGNLGSRNLLAHGRRLVSLHSLPGRPAKQLHDLLGIAQSLAHLPLEGHGLPAVVPGELLPVGLQFGDKGLKPLLELVKEGLVLLGQSLHELAFGQDVRQSLGDNLPAGLIKGKPLLLHGDLHQCFGVRAVTLHLGKDGLSEIIIRRGIPLFNKVDKFVGEGPHHGVGPQIGGIPAVGSGCDIDVDGVLPVGEAARLLLLSALVQHHIHAGDFCIKVQELICRFLGVVEGLAQVLDGNPLTLDCALAAHRAAGGGFCVGRGLALSRQSRRSLAQQICLPALMLGDALGPLRVDGPLHRNAAVAQLPGGPDALLKDVRILPVLIQLPNGPSLIAEALRHLLHRAGGLCIFCTFLHSGGRIGGFRVRILHILHSHFHRLGYGLGCVGGVIQHSGCVMSCVMSCVTCVIRYQLFGNPGRFSPVHYFGFPEGILLLLRLLQIRHERVFCRCFCGLWGFLSFHRGRILCAVPLLPQLFQNPLPLRVSLQSLAFLSGQLLPPELLGNGGCQSVVLNVRFCQYLRRSLDIRLHRLSQRLLFLPVHPRFRSGCSTVHDRVGAFQQSAGQGTEQTGIQRLRAVQADFVLLAQYDVAKQGIKQLLNIFLASLGEHAVAQLGGYLKEYVVQPVQRSSDPAVRELVCDFADAIPAERGDTAKDPLHGHLRSAHQNAIGGGLCVAVAHVQGFLPCSACRAGAHQTGADPCGCAGGKQARDSGCQNGGRHIGGGGNSVIAQLPQRCTAQPVGQFRADALQIAAHHLREVLPRAGGALSVAPQTAHAFPKLIEARADAGCQLKGCVSLDPLEFRSGSALIQISCNQFQVCVSLFLAALGVVVSVKLPLLLGHTIIVGVGQSSIVRVPVLLKPCVRSILCARCAGCACGAALEVICAYGIAELLIVDPAVGAVPILCINRSVLVEVRIIVAGAAVSCVEQRSGGALVKRLPFGRSVLHPGGRQALPFGVPLPELCRLLHALIIGFQGSISISAAVLCPQFIFPLGHCCLLTRDGSRGSRSRSRRSRSLVRRSGFLPPAA